MRYSYTFYLLLASVFSNSVTAQVEGWWKTCISSSPVVHEILINGCGFDAKSEHVLLKTGKAPFDLKNYHLKISVANGHTPVGEVLVQPNSSNLTALNYLNNSYKGCYFGNVFIDAQSQQYSGIIPPESALLIFNDKNNTDVYYLNEVILKNWCSSKIFVAFGTVFNNVGGKSLFENFIPNNQCTNMCLRQIEINLDSDNSFCEKIIYDVSKLPHSQLSPPATEGKGSYIVPKINNGVDYLGGQLYGFNSCVPEKLFDNSDCISNPLHYAIKIDSSFIGASKIWRVAIDTSNIISPLKIKWNGSSAINTIDFNTVSMLQGNYTFQISDGRTCNAMHNLVLGNALAFSVKISGKDTICAGSLDSLTALVSNGTAPINVDWFDAIGNSVQTNSLSYMPNVTMNTFFVARATDGSGLITLDTFKIIARTLPKLKMSLNAGIIVCNDAVVEFYAAGASTYSWSSTPSIASYALNKTTGDTVKLFALFLPAPGFIISLTGTDAFGCSTKVDTAIKIVPLPRATINPVVDTICDTDAPFKLTGTAEPGVTVDKYTASCGACVVGDTFYPKLAKVGKNLVVHDTENASGCKNAPSIIINVKICTCTNPPVVVAGSDVSVCKNQSINLNGNSQFAQSTLWSTNGTGSFTDSSNVKTVYTPSVNDSVRGSIKIYLASMKPTILGCKNVKDSLIIKFGMVNAVTIPVTSCNLADVGTKSVTLKNQNGCDSIITTVTTFAKSDSIIVPATSCNVADVGTKILKLKNRNGCDSIVTRVTTLIKSDSIIVPATSCNVADVGTKILKLKNRNGCDSIVTTVTTLIKSDSIIVPATSCNVADVGTKILKLKNSNGCDSIVTTVTTLIKSDSIFISATSCNAANVGTKILKLKNRNGCDSIVTTTTKFSQTVSTFIPATSCNLADVGTKVLKFKNTNGCDSIVTTLTTLVKSDSVFIPATSCNLADVGTKILKLKNRNGCDSIVTTLTTLVKSDSVFIPVTSCNLADVGTKILKLKNRNGCDSIVTTLTTLVKSDSTFFNIHTCDASQVGIKILKFVSISGCDSIVQTTVQLKNSIVGFGLSVVKKITCNSGNDGAIGLLNPRGGTAPYSVQWRNGYNTDTIKNLQAGNYSVTLTDAKGCATSDSIILQQPVPISANFTAVPPLCYPDAIGTINLNSISNATLPVKIIFYNVNYDSIKTPYTFKNVSVGASSFSFIDKNKCRLDTTVTMPTAPIRQFNLGSDIRIALGDSANIGAAINFLPQNIKWTPPMGLNCDSCLNPIAKPIVSTKYVVILKDSLGCTLTDNITVYIDKRRSVFIPNSFSPNGDNINDVFTPFADQTVDKINEFSVFNRWGEKVYSLQNYKLDAENIGWHGDFKGVPSSVGVYTFFVNILYKDGKTETMQGEVTLFR